MNDLPPPTDSPNRFSVITGRSSTEKNGQTAPDSPVAQQVLAVLRSDASSAVADPKKPDDSLIPARMLNEFVYCARLFYYEHVEGLFVESVDTRKGSALHARVDSGSGRLPAPQTSSQEKSATEDETESPAPPLDTIHSRSVQLSSQRLGVIAKMDLVESVLADDLFSVREVSPVDYKVGAPREGPSGLELWDTDKMQLGLQALILRDNGYTCHHGIIYYRATKQRLPLEITPELESWILEKLAQARAALLGSIPDPLVDSPKCARCSLAPVCLPDETLLLQNLAEEAKQSPPRRLIAPRDETRPLYLNTQGHRVGTKGETLQVKDKDTLVQEIRIRDLSHVALFGNIQITTQAIQNLCQLDIPISYFSMGGWFYGITRGHHLKNILLRIEQFRQAGEPAACLNLARQFVHGKIRNHRTLLMRNHISPPAPAILRLKRAAEDAQDAASLEELLGIEGAAASLYFQHLSGMIKLDEPDEAKPAESLDPAAELSAQQPPLLTRFNFTTRNRRPPTDPVNAMLSLAYSLLSKDCTLACLAVGLDPYVGFYHQPRFGRPALALDLMEEFRPLIAESVVLSAINNRIVTEKDFVTAGTAVNLSASGRKGFFMAYEQRLNSLITHPIFEYKVSYRRALELQARLLGKTLTGEIPLYTPLLTR